MTVRSNFERATTPTGLAQDVLMIGNLINFAVSGDRDALSVSLRNSCSTQEPVDAFWLALPKV
jgi:hypothetical protein